MLSAVEYIGLNLSKKKHFKYLQSNNLKTRKLLIVFKNNNEDKNIIARLFTPTKRRLIHILVICLIMSPRHFRC